VKEQIILFDLDDTLVHCNKYFNAVLDQFADLLSGWFGGHGVKQEHVLQKQIEIDMAGIHEHGLLPERFPESLVETYFHYCDLLGLKKRQDEADFLRKLGFSVYDIKIEPYPHMRETLNAMRADGHHLCLYTGGEPSIQLRKVEQMKLGEFFGERIFVTLHKTTEYMKYLIHHHGFEKSRTWMIGNSVRTDVMPALENGIHAIHIRAEQEWQFNEVAITAKPQGAFLNLPSLREVPDAIRAFIAGDSNKPSV